MIALLIQSTGETMPLKGATLTSSEHGGRLTDQPTAEGALISGHYTRNADLHNISVTADRYDAVSMHEQLMALKGQEVVDLQWPGWPADTNLVVERVGRVRDGMDGASFTFSLKEHIRATSRTEDREAPQPTEPMEAGQADEVDVGPRGSTEIDGLENAGPSDVSVLRSLLGSF